MTYDGEQMNKRGLTLSNRMRIQTRTIVPGLLLTFGAMAANAQPKAPEAAPAVSPAATQPSTPIDLSLPSLVTPPSAPIDLSLPSLATPPSAPVDLLQSASEEVKRVARWVIDSGDNTHLPFLLIDKVNAQVFVFGPAGQLQGTAPALLGMARGDRMLVPNNAPMSAMPPNVRITPAGRFVSRLAVDSTGKELLVLDYDASLSLHPVVKGTPKERRAERLSSATAQDNRVSYGCINVPVPFYSKVVSPTFTGTKGIVYVLPETSPASALFGMQAVGTALTGTQQTSPAPNAPAAQAVPATGAN